jgi:nicotinate-nucleotide pyrophosphorylase (carboxylating)
MFLPRRILEEKLLGMLSDDVGQGDITTTLVVPPENTAQAEIKVKEAGVVAGIEEIKVLLDCLQLRAEALVSDGEKVRAQQVIMKISGNARTILTAERTLLNVLCRMSGIATITNGLIEKLQKAKLKTRVACTRKTAPGLLYFDKKAVFVGGGDPHRLHLDDMILIKDNHLALAGSVREAVGKVRARVSFSKKIEVEVSSPNDALAAAEAGADIILLDNFSPKQVEKAVRLLKERDSSRRVLIEASGGITAENVLEFASTHVDIVSLGELTDSVKALDMSLEITKVMKSAGRH